LKNGNSVHRRNSLVYAFSCIARTINTNIVPWVVSTLKWQLAGSTGEVIGVVVPTIWFFSASVKENMTESISIKGGGGEWASTSNWVINAQSKSIFASFAVSSPVVARSTVIGAFHTNGIILFVQGASLVCFVFTDLTVALIITNCSASLGEGFLTTTSKCLTKIFVA
jgi:hypothetical protein